MIIRIEAPTKFINSNQRLHPMAKAKLTAQWRTAACLAAQDAAPVATPVRIVAHVHKPRGGRWDPGNWYPTAKACVDGLVDSGLLADDSHREVEGPDMRAGEKGEPALTLTITHIRPTKE